MDNTITTNEIEIKEFTLKVHKKPKNRGLSNNHIMAYFEGNEVNPIVTFINNWEMNARIFHNQIMKYKVKCVDENGNIDKEKIAIVEALAQKAYDNLADEHHNIAIMMRNVKNNPIISMVYGQFAQQEEKLDLVNALNRNIKPQTKKGEVNE